MEKKVTYKAFIAVYEGSPIWISEEAFDDCNIPVILHIANMKRPVSDKTRKKIAKLLQEFHSDRFADSEKTLVTIFKCLHLDTSKIARPYTIDK